MKPLTLYPHEIRRLQSTGSVLVWRPIKPQPPAYINDLHGRELSKRAPYTLEDNETGIIIGVGFFDDDDSPYICPHPPGSERWVRETWATDIHNNGDSPKRIAELCREAGYSVGPGYPAGPIWYQADGIFRRWGLYRDVRGRWRSPVTMPRWASRLSVVSKAVQARQVESITKDETEAAGIRHGGPMLNYLDFSSWWQSRYGKPCKTCKGDGAVTAWSGSSSGNDVQLDTEVCPDCNGEPMPLEWDANPWAWATTLERKEG